MRGGVVLAADVRTEREELRKPELQVSSSIVKRVMKSGSAIPIKAARLNDGMTRTGSGVTGVRLPGGRSVVSAISTAVTATAAGTA